MNNYWYLGVVRTGRFQVLHSETGATGVLRLTAALAGTDPAPGEISLAREEGSALMVRGVDHEGWIHSAGIVDRGGPIVTALAEQVFFPASGGRS